MYSVMWKLISVLLGLLAFVVVCIVSMFNGEELFTSVVKSIGAFFVLWMLFSVMGVIFTRVVPTGDEEFELVDDTNEQDAGVQQNVFPTIAAVSDDGLPEIEAGSGLGKAA